jgi:quercetin dioxygenase-like cupin family protein
VAGDTLTVLYEGPDALLMDFRFPPGISLPDHATGPRVVLVMTDGVIERTGGEQIGQRTELTAGTALWLEGSVGSGFVNAGDEALRYLVYQPLDGFAQEQLCQPEFLIRGDGEVSKQVESPEANVWRVDIRGEAWIQLGDGTRRSVVVLGDGRVPVLIAGEVLHIQNTSALVFCHL